MLCDGVKCMSLAQNRV